jgi:hypothetical protein
MRALVHRSKHLAGDYLLEIDAPVDERAMFLPFLFELIDLIALIGSHGALTEEHADGVMPRFVVLQRESDDLVRFVLSLNAIDVRFVELIRSAIAHCNAEQLPEGLSLMPCALASQGVPDQVELPWPDYSRSNIYPAMTSSPCFQLSMDDETDSRMRRLVVSFGAKQAAEDISRLEELISPWAKLLECGAFSLPSDAPKEAQSTFGCVQLFGPESIEIVIDRFDANEAGLELLVNMLDTYARQQVRIVEVLVN